MTDKKTRTARKNGELYRLKLPADSANLDIIRRFVSGIAENMGFSGDDIYEIELAVDEACANVVKHAYANAKNGEKIINVRVKDRKDRIEISIADKGVGFKPDELPTPDMDKYLKEMKKGGLGVHLIRTLMDEVHFHMSPGVRNEVKMTKLVPQPRG
ncbi:MAG TPA: ATP-binding protein [Calditrichia bacterium]|nr:ATP-binding protein [Calditrichia bacterium]HQV32226.1 ATP-binding protein [Calditrichia bacterium]